MAVWLSIQRSLKAPFKKEREREEEEEETKKEKETLSWWMIVELLRRIVFILVITIFPYSTVSFREQRLVILTPCLPILLISYRLPHY